MLGAPDMLIKPLKTRRFKLNESLFEFICANLRTLSDGAILVITSKIVALAEGRFVPNASAAKKIELMRAESDYILRTRYSWLTIKDGVVLGSAGIDESNANGGLILLPRDSYKVAAMLRRQLIKKFKIKKLGIIITDSRMMPLRAGVVAIALGYAGFKGLRDYRGQPDLDKRPLHFTRTDVADSLATAAVITMGEGNESQPLALITTAPVEWTSGPIDRTELYIDPREDVYVPLWQQVRKWGKFIGPRIRYKKRK